MEDFERVFEVPALVLKSVPGFMKGASRGALKISLEEIRKGQVARNVETTTRGWKLFMLDVALQTTPRRPHSTQEVGRKVGGNQRW